MDSFINNEKLNRSNKEVKKNLHFSKIKESIQNQNIYNIDLTKTLSKVKDLNSLIGAKNYNLFDNAYKSDDEENINDQKDIYKCEGRKSIGELDILLNNDKIESEENSKDINYKYLDDVIEKWKYEKLLLNNNIIDYYCK
jgi:hypothetical protein